VDAGWIVSRRHNVHGLFEIDVTEARRIIKERRAATGESISFTAFMVYCIARAAGGAPHIHATRDWLGRLAVFHDVNVNTMISAEIDGNLTVAPLIIRAADKKSVKQISDEIRAAQESHKAGRGGPEAKYISRFVKLPATIRRLFYWHLYRKPAMLSEMFGTVAVTAVGMFTGGGGWGIPFGNHTLSVALGGIARKPAAVGDEIKIREYLSVTITIDHDIVDGAPAARFVRELRDSVESAGGLRDI
jgi:pyruvate/2-oxoglutarate dehydrogenase complex dihydrolipoamide acyltransferase (E2) component